MQRFLSYVVDAPDDVFIEEHLLALGAGRNAFSVTVTDPDAFHQRLTDAGCVVRSVFVLDDHEAVEPAPEIVAAQQAARLLRGG